jgi:hypothetical protein
MSKSGGTVGWGWERMGKEEGEQEEEEKEERAGDTWRWRKRG